MTEMVLKPTTDMNWDIDLEHGVTLTIRIYDVSDYEDDNHSQLLFNYNYLYRVKNKKREVEFQNDIKLHVRYMNGISTECKLSWNMAVPEKFRDKYEIGEAFSPHDKLYAQFVYQKEHIKFDKYIPGSKMYPEYLPQWRMVELDTGLKVQKFTGKEGLIQQIPLPFPVLDVIVLELEDMGDFVVPYPHISEKDTMFKFPDTIYNSTLVPKDEVEDGHIAIAHKEGVEVYK